MKSYPQLAARLFGTPLLLVPDKAETIASVLAERLHVAPMIEVDPDGLRVRAGFGDGGDDQDQTYAVVNGVAVISIVGELVNRGSWMDAWSGLTSYAGIANDLQAALADDEVEGIVLDIDSPGGEAAGAMETAALVRKASSVKPVTAFVNGAAASAAYAIASGAPRIVVTPSATLGSIGVVLLHLDRSERMAKDGLKPTLIKKGAYKTDGTSLEPLAAEARARIDSLLDVVYGLFASTVAAHRPALNLEAVKATEAGLYIGQQAIDAGLADEIGTLDDVVRSMASTRTTLPGTMGLKGTDMTDITKAEHEAALAIATNAGLKTGSEAERTRVSAILDSEDAKGRETLAKHLAFSTDMKPEAAAAVLKASPKTEAKTGSRLDGRVPTPDVDADQGEGSGTTADTEMDEYAKGAAAAKLALGIR